MACQLPYVSYNMSQSRDENKKKQARENIGAISKEEAEECVKENILSAGYSSLVSNAAISDEVLIGHFSGKCEDSPSPDSSGFTTSNFECASCKDVSQNNVDITASKVDVRLITSTNSKSISFEIPVSDCKCTDDLVGCQIQDDKVVISASSRPTSDPSASQAELNLSDLGLDFSLGGQQYWLHSSLSGDSRDIEVELYEVYGKYEGDVKSFHIDELIRRIVSLEDEVKQLSSKLKEIDVQSKDGGER